MSAHDASDGEENRQECIQMLGLQAGQQQDARFGEDERTEQNAGLYFFLISGHEALYAADGGCQKYGKA